MQARLQPSKALRLRLERFRVTTYNIFSVFESVPACPYTHAHAQGKDNTMTTKPER